MHRRPLFRAASAAALLACAASAGAVPGPPLGCTGQPGVGGCAPYLNVYLSDDGSALNLFEYDLARIDISRSRLLTDARGTGNLELGLLTAAARRAEDADPGNVLAVDVIATLVDVYTLHSPTPLPPGSDVFNITVMASATGVGSIDTDYRVVQSLLHLGMGGGLLAYHGGVLDSGSVLQALTHVPTFQQFTLPLHVYANVTVRVGQPFEINASLRTLVSESSFLNFDSFFGIAHGARLSFVLPPGMSVTSLGGFDSAAPVPEPGTWALWLAALSVLGRIMRTHAAAVHQDAGRGQRLRRARRDAHAARALA